MEYDKNIDFDSLLDPRRSDHLARLGITKNLLTKCIDEIQIITHKDDIFLVQIHIKGKSCWMTSWWQDSFMLPEETIANIIYCAISELSPQEITNCTFYNNSTFGMC